MYVDGGTLITSLLREDLVDEMVRMSCLDMRVCQLEAAAKWDKWPGRLKPLWLFGCLEVMLSKDGSPWVLEGENSSPHCSAMISLIKWCVCPPTCPTCLPPEVDTPACRGKTEDLVDQMVRPCLGMRVCRHKAAAKSGGLKAPWLFGCLEAMLSKDGSSWVLEGEHASSPCFARIWSMQWCVSRVQG